MLALRPIRAAALRAGFDISAQRARQITEQDFSRFTHILVMDENNLRDVLRLKSKSTGAQVMRLLDYAPTISGKNVADPYYGDDQDFDETVSLVHAGCMGLFEHLIERISLER